MDSSYAAESFESSTGVSNADINNVDVNMGMLVDEPIIMLSLLVNGGGLICSITAVLCLLINPTIEQSLRAILVSFTLSNVAGSGMLVFGVFKYASHRSDQHSLDYIVMMAVVMSLSHILLLILHYYIALTTSKKKMALDFSGLIITAWITSAAIGSMINVSTRHSVGHVMVLVGFIAMFLYAVRAYFFILNKHRKKDAVQKQYRESYLREDEDQDIQQGSRQWNLKLLAIMLFTYIGCSLPWLTNEVIVDNEHNEMSGQLGSYVVMMVYAVNFYVPSILCIMIACRNCSMFKRRSKGHSCQGNSIEDKYRLRRLYSTNSERAIQSRSIVD